MVAVKLLGTIDFITAILFWIFIVFNLTGLTQIITVLGIFLLIKGIVFATTMDIASVLDIVSSIIIIVASSFNIPVLLAIIVGIYLLQKGIFSWF